MKLRWSTLRNLLFIVCVFFFVGSFGLVLVYRVFPVPATPLMFWRSTQAAFSGELLGIHKDWVPLEEISPSMVKAVLKAEDYKFYEHRGFDFEAIEKAVKYNKTHKRKKGASTITQQTVKNVFLWPNRDWVRKGFEAYFTVLVETLWPKERILEVYLNVIELGHGVYGVEAASQRYFKRSAKKINPAQASLLAAVLPNPRRFRVDRPSNYVLGRQRRILYRASPQIPAVGNSFFDFLDFKFSSQED